MLTLSLSDIFNVFLGFLAIGTALLQLRNYLLSKLKQAKATAKLGNSLAQQLCEHATNAAKRADIYFYNSLQIIERQAQRTRNEIFITGVLLAIFILNLFAALVMFLLKISPYQISAVIFIFIDFACLGSVSMLIFYLRLIHKVEDDWQTGLNKALHEKIGKHFSSN